MRESFYNHSTLELENQKADTVAVKGLNTAVKVYDLTDGVVTINTDDFTAGEYTLQFFKGDQVVQQKVLDCKQNLKYVSPEYDPRTPARVILQAIDAVLAGRATQLQEQVRVGEKYLRYMSYDELMKWRNFYATQARKEQGKAATLRFEKLYWRGGF